MTRFTVALGLMVLAAACTTSVSENASRDALEDVQPVALSPVSLPAPVIALSDGRCQARETLPAVYEQVMGEVQVVQAEIAPDGTVLRPPVYRRAPVPKVVRPRSDVIFDAVCGHQMTPDFIASLQRALAARGYFAGNVTSWIDAATSAAIRKYQAERGLESAQLSLETARSLGLITVDAASGPDDI
ncbi:peptidoglycan-binding domain-containing protein [Sagittula sp.]|uniref:peptidoglycan-binding domain-containing protein n=1 Tax=Sagittula sp. TaxID=2038081 RepID=UPI0035137CA3